MNEAELDTLMKQSEQQFNELKVKEGTLKEQLGQVDTSLKQLQGEYEAYNTIKKTLQERGAATKAELTGDPIAASLPDPFKSKSDKKEARDASK